jgi:hypothetical protein
MESDSDESGEIEWQPVDTPAEAATILHASVFEFANVIYKLYKADEASHPNKYLGKLLPSAKIFVITGLLHCWDNNKERLCEHYVNHVLSWRTQIDERDADFFLENNEIYTGPGGRKPKPEDIEFFKDLWRPNSTFKLKDEEKEACFVYFDTMLHYCSEWKRMSNYTAIWETEATSAKVVQKATK